MGHSEDPVLLELRQFASRENSLDARTSWVQHVELDEEEQLLTLWLLPPLGHGGVGLELPLPVYVHFGCRLCYAECEAGDPLVDVVSAANDALASGTTVVHAASVLAIRAGRVHQSLWPQPASGTAEVRAAILEVLRKRPRGSGLSLVLLGLAAASYRRETVARPLPWRTGTRSKAAWSYPALVDATASLPAMSSLAAEGLSALDALPPPPLELLYFLLVRMRSSIGDPTPFTSSSSSTPAGAAVGASALEFPVSLPQDPVFDALVKRNGRLIGYHGSPPENWHSIVQNGLEVMSHGRKMRNGAMWGEGIYLAADLKVALGFADASPLLKQAWAVAAKQQLLPGGGGASSSCGGFLLVAKCEIAALPGYTLHGNRGAEQGAYYVVKEAAHVRLLSLLLYPTSSAGRRAAGDQAAFSRAVLAYLVLLVVALAVPVVLSALKASKRSLGWQ